MKRLEFLEKARALAQQQCEESSCFPGFEFAEVIKSVAVGDTSEEVELYKKALEILTDAAHDMDSAFTEVSRNFAEE